MSLLINSSGIVISGRVVRHPLRFNNGIPVITYATDSITSRRPYTSLNVIPTSFPDSGNGTTYYDTPFVVANNGDRIYFIAPLVSGMSAFLRSNHFTKTGTSSSEGDVNTYDALPTTPYVDFAIDGNGNFHVVWLDDTSAMGTPYTTLYYTNNIGGTWKTRVEILGASSSVNVIECSIIIDKDNIPFVYYTQSTSRYFGIGNVTNATSFSSTVISVTIAYTRISLCSDIRGDHYLFGIVSNILQITKHENGAGIGGTTTTYNGKIFNAIFGVKIAGNYAFVFFKDNTNNANGVSIARIDISGTTPSVVGVMEDTSDNWSTFSVAQWKTNPYYLNFNKFGVDVGVTSKASDVDVVFQVFDSGSSEYDPYWNTYDFTPTITLNTADASEFADTTPTLEATGDEIFDLDTLEYDVQVMTAINSVVDSYSESNQDTQWNVRFGIEIMVGQSFTGDGKYLSRATFYIRKVGSPTGVVRAKLYAHSGTFGTSSVGTGNPLAVSTTFLDISTLTTSFALSNFDFDGSYQLLNGTKYVIVVEYSTGDTSNYLQVGIDVSSASHSGNSCYYNTAWTANSANDVIFYINGNTVLLDRESDVDTSEFVNTVTGGDTHPFNDAEKIAFTVDRYYFVNIPNNGSGLAMSLNLNTSYAQSFTGINGDLNNAYFRLYRINSSTGNLVAKLYAHSGTFGTSSVPTGTALATSNSISSTTITETTIPGQLVKFTFSTPYTMTAGTKYCIAIEYDGGSGTNWITVMRNTNDVHEGNISSYDPTVWTAGTGDLDVSLESSIELSLTTHYWRARARSGDLTGYWSAVRSFLIAIASNNVSKIKVSNWKDFAAAPQINIGGVWKTVTAVKINIGGVWKDVDITP